MTMILYQDTDEGSMDPYLR